MEKEKVIHSIPPLWDAECRVLLLGSLPSPKSRSVGFYYGHPQNRFWPVLAGLFEEAVPFGTEERASFALRHHIALWDVIQSCTIEGAADNSIQEVVPNPVETLLLESKIKAIFTTGAKAHSLYEKYCFDKTGLHAFLLPSTSPANCARYDLAKLIYAYRALLPFLE